MGEYSIEAKVGVGGWGCQRRLEARWTPVGFAWSHSVANAYLCVAQQLRICLCDGKSKLLLDILFGGGCCVGVTVESRSFILLPFDACRRDDA